MRRSVSVYVPTFGTGTYCYWCQFEDLKVGDHVVIEAPNHELLIGVVQDIKPKRQQHRKANKWLVDRIELDAYRALSAMVDHPEVTEGERQ